MLKKIIYIDEKGENFIYQHATWLADDENYLYGTNHGVYQDKALLYLGCAIDNNEYIEIAKRRINLEVKEMFTDECVSTENSFNYHRINKELFQELGLILNNLDDDYGKELLNLAKTAENFMGYAIKPDGNCSTYGDTLLSDYKNCRYLNSNSALAYVSNKNNRKDKEKFLLKKIVSFPESGYFICREFWEDKSECNFEPEDSTWLLFKSGYTKITHKQADDNSFSLYSRGHDIFVDCGMYNYMYRDPIRHYIRTANAHNTVIADETSFEFLRQDLAKRCGIAYSYIDDSLGYVIGYNCLYHGICHIRHLIFYEKQIFILDEIESNYNHKYSQLFHLGKDMKLSYFNNEKFVAFINEKSYVELEQFNNTESLNSEIVNGKMEKINGKVTYGIMSENFNSYFPINTIKFNLVGNTCSFATSIVINDINHEKSSFSYNESERCLSINKNGYENRKVKLIHKNELKEKLPAQLKLSNIEINITMGTLILEDKQNYKEKYEHAWYIVDSKSKEKLLIKMYEKNSRYKCSLDELDTNEFFVRAFLLDKRSNKKFSQIIADFYKADGKWKYERRLNIDPSLL